MAVIGSLLIELSANVARLEKDLGQAVGHVKNTERMMANSIRNMNAVFGTLGVTLGAAQFAGLIKSSIDLQDELLKLKHAYGITAKEAAGLKFAADQNGASLDMVARATKELMVNMATAPEKFAKLGINAQDATGALAQVADIVAQMPEGQQKVALLAELMGKKLGPEMAEFMSVGGAAMRDYIERGKDIYKITDENAAKAKQFKDQMAELNARLDGAAVSISANMLPAMNSIVERSLVAQREYGTLVGLLALVGNTALSAVGVEIDPKKRAENEINAIYKERLALWKDLEIFKSRLDDKNANWEYARKDIARTEESLKKLEERLQKIRDRAPEITGTPASAKPDSAALPYQWQSPVEDELDRFKKYKAARESASKTFLGQSDELSFIEEEQRWQKHRKRLEDLQKPMQRGESLVSGLGVDFNNEFDKKLRDLNSPLMSAVDKQHADNLAEVSERAARAKESLDSLNLTEADRAKLTKDINELTAVQVDRMEDLRRQIEANNSSWLHGAQVAMRTYLDEAANVARQSEDLFTKAFKGMEDALVQFATKGKLDFASLADSIISDMARIAIRQSITGPLMGMMANAFGGASMGPGSNYAWGPAGGMAGMNPNTPILNANGNVFGFANGGAFTNGVFDRTTPFRFAGGGGFNLGIMGEAGPEAVMPLARDSSGKLGVRAQGGGGVNINYAPTIQIDSRSDQAQVHQLVHRAVRQGNAELVDTLQRRGVI